MQNAENEMAIIAAYYGLPTLSVRAAVFHQMLKNQHGYRVRVAWALYAPAMPMHWRPAGGEHSTTPGALHWQASRAAPPHLLLHSFKHTYCWLLPLPLCRWIACAPRIWRRAASRMSCSCLTSPTPTAPPATGECWRRRGLLCSCLWAQLRLRP